MPVLFEARVLLSRSRLLLRRVARGTRKLKAERSRFYVELWSEAAAAVGATVAEGRDELLIISRGEATALVFRNYTDLDGPVTLRAAGDKAHVHATLRAHGLPTPDSLQFSLSQVSAARAFLRAHSICAVKPAFGTGAGEGVTTRVTTPAELDGAMIAAAAHCPELLIESYVEGDNLRLLYLDGRLLDAVQRCPPSVVGDGIASIGTLVARANRERVTRGAIVAQTSLKRDLDMRRTLASQGLSYRHVPARGERVVVKTVINDNAAADNVTASARVGESLVEAGRRAAAALGVRLAGVDVITRDPKTALSESGGVVLEVNTTPGLYFHRAKEGRSVAAPILEACLEQSLRNSMQRRSTTAATPETEARA